MRHNWVIVPIWDFPKEYMYTCIYVHIYMSERTSFKKIRQRRATNKVALETTAQLFPEKHLEEQEVTGQPAPVEILLSIRKN